MSSLRLISSAFSYLSLSLATFSKCRSRCSRISGVLLKHREYTSKIMSSVCNDRQQAANTTFDNDPRATAISVMPSVTSAAPLVQQSPPQPPQLHQPAARGWRFWAAFVPMCVGTLLAAFETTVTSTALPSIVSDLGSGDLYVWILNGYLLTRYSAALKRQISNSDTHL